MKIKKMFLLAFATLIFAESFAGTLNVTVNPNPFEQGSLTTFTIYLPQNETVRTLTIDFYSGTQFLFQVSPRITSPTTLYGWNGCNPNNNQCLPPGTYSYVVKAGCGCGGRSTYEATGNVTIVAAGGGTQPPSGCYATESECKNNNAHKCNCGQAVNCQYDSVNKCYLFSNCDNSKCASGGGGGTQPPTAKVSVTSFLQMIGQCGAINYAAIAECPTEGPTAYPEEGKLGYWCKVRNIGSPGQEGAIRYWAVLRNDPNNQYDDLSYEIYIFYAKRVCQNPPQAEYVGCDQCILLLENMNVVHEAPKSVVDGAIATLKRHQSCGGGGGGAPGPGPGPGPSTPAPPSSPSPQQSPAPVPSQEPPASGGGITADARPNPFQQGSTTTFTITAQSGQAISQIYIEIYDLTGSKVYDSGWVNGNKLVWNGIGNYGRWNNVALRTQAYIFVASAKVGSETKGPARGYVYIVPASGGPAKSPSPGTSQGPGGPAQSPGQSPGQPATQVPPGNECQTNADCVCNDACYNGRCIHPELTINGSANTLLAYTGKPLETTIVWTITNAGDDAAVLKDVKPSGCENVTCELQIQAGTTIKIAGNTNQELRKKDSKINLEGKDTKVIEKGLKLELQSNFKFDYGEVEVGLDWKAVKLKNIYTSPIVVAKPIESCSSNGKTQCDKVVVRIKNVQTNSFEIRLQKWGEGWNQPLTRNYKVQYLVLEEGTNDLNGLQIEAGKFKATQSVVFNIYKSKFSTTPILITSIATFNGSHPAVTRNRNPIPCVGVFALFCKIANFATNIQEEKTLLRYIHSEEEIHYVAISTGKAIIGDTQWEIRRIQGVNDEGTTIFYESDFPETPIVIADFQTVNDDDPIMLRYYKKERDSIHFFAAEEDSSLIDICWWCHRPEDVGYIAIAKTGSTGLKAVIETDKDGCTCPPCTINFDGSKSTGNIVSYEWDFGDNNAKATGQKVSYTYTKNGTYTVKLTVKDSNGNSASATKTITVSDCTQPIKGTVIEPGRSIKIIQKVKGLNPGKYEFDLQASYTDLFNASAKQTNEWKKIIVEVAKLGSEKFSVKLVGEEQDFCIGPNGLFGITGKAAVPKVKLSWQFEGDAAIKIDDCDDKGTDSFIYCDPTQFSIALAQKLKKIYELASNKRYAETKSYTSFKAHLIGDNYSENFQKDFVKAYTEGFLKAPTWFISGATPWSKYFSDPNALSFEPRQIDSGLYIVTLDINFNTEDWVFFREGKPDAKIKVKFEKVRDAAADVEEIPFYYLPFNGLVGKDGRTDYGIGYTNQNNPIVISVVGNADKIETSTPRGRMHISTAIYSELKDILNAQNNLFKVDLAGKKIELYISQPMPILMGIRSKNGRGECFYKIYSLQSAIGSGFDGISYWTGIATSPDLNCRDFSGLELPLKKKDTQAALIDSSCAAKKNNLPAFGFYWNGVPNNQSLFLSTVFYTPHGKKMSISNACSSDVCLLASKSGLSRDIGESLSLDSSLKAEKISEIIPLIEQEYVCIVPELEGVHPSQNSYVFFWNEQKLLKDLEIAKTRVASEWGFNWQNYKCD